MKIGQKVLASFHSQFCGSCGDIMGEVVALTKRGGLVKMECDTILEFDAVGNCFDDDNFQIDRFL